MKVKLSRDYIRLSPISSAIIPHRTPDGRLAKTGYVKLSAFSQVYTAILICNLSHNCNPITKQFHPIEEFGYIDYSMFDSSNCNL